MHPKYNIKPKGYELLLLRSSTTAALTLKEKKSYQESIVSERNVHLAAFCAKQEENWPHKKELNPVSFVYVEQYRVAFCPIGKTGTSTWFSRFGKLTGLDRKQQGEKQKKQRPLSNMEIRARWS